MPACWSCLLLELLRSIWRFPLSGLEKTRLSWALMVRFCVTNVPVAAGIRADVKGSMRKAWRVRAWRSLAVLIVAGALVYPLHNRASRSLYRIGRRVSARF